MLLPSTRHTKADLELWKEYEEADLVIGEPVSRVVRSLHAIEAFLSSGGAWLATSWGKDSVVCCHLLWRLEQWRGRVPVVNLRVKPSRNPYCDDVRDAFLSRFPQDYSEHEVDYSSLDRNMPDMLWDKATDKLWYGAISQVNARYGKRHITGVAARESWGRMVRCRSWGESSPNGCAPLAWWSTSDVFSYLAAHDLPVHPNYAMLGGGRWPRERLRVAELGDSRGAGFGRREWETEYYRDLMRR